MSSFRPLRNAAAPSSRRMALVQVSVVASAMTRAAIASPSTGDDPGRIEPPVRRAVIREPRDVPMADEWSVGGPDRRPSTDVDHAVGIAGNHIWRLLAGAYRDDGAVLVGKSRDAPIGPGSEQDDVAARQLEEARTSVVYSGPFAPSHGMRP